MAAVVDQRIQGGDTVMAGKAHQGSAADIWNRAVRIERMHRRTGVYLKSICRVVAVPERCIRRRGGMRSMTENANLILVGGMISITIASHRRQIVWGAGNLTERCSSYQQE